MFTAEQVTSITTAVTSLVGDVIANFVLLLPAVIAITAAIWGLHFVMGQIKEFKKKKNSGNA